mmetsp:Transcript_37746/g.55341  ORF Transcript_37746/g.55341 Transcript_37746/m.55341 type:complete len:222 (-) Transcript_37746:228-893(-)
MERICCFFRRIPSRRAPSRGNFFPDSSPSSSKAPSRSATSCSLGRMSSPSALSVGMEAFSLMLPSSHLRRAARPSSAAATSLSSGTSSTVPWAASASCASTSIPLRRGTGSTQSQTSRTAVYRARASAADPAKCGARALRWPIAVWQYLARPSSNTWKSSDCQVRASRSTGIAAASMLLGFVSITIFSELRMEERSAWPAKGLPWLPSVVLGAEKSRPCFW